MWKSDTSQKEGSSHWLKHVFKPANLFLAFVCHLEKAKSKTRSSLQRLLWDGSALQKIPHLVNWIIVYSNKNHEGLGIRNLKLYLVTRAGDLQLRDSPCCNKFWEGKGGWCWKDVQDDYGVGWGWGYLRQLETGRMMFKSKSCVLLGMT